MVRGHLVTKGGEGHRPLPRACGGRRRAVWSFSRVAVHSCAGGGEEEARTHLAKKHRTRQVVIGACWEEKGATGDMGLVGVEKEGHRRDQR